MTVAGLIDAHRQKLTPAERRVADVVLSSPQAVAFGTVADLADRANTSGATVVRLAAKLGLDGFTALQAEVQAELAHRLRPAAERIRETQPGDDVLTRSLAVELDNVAGTFDAIAPDAFDAVVALLADTTHRVYVLAGEASRGVGLVLVDELAMLRSGVELVWGTDVRLGRILGELTDGDIFVVIDLRRYERWVLSTTDLAHKRGARVVALCDSALSPLADVAWHTFVVRAEGAGPFDSHVGTLALVNALLAGLATQLRASATDRLDRIETAWRDAGALIDG